MIDTITCWILWFTITLTPGQIGHFPVTGEFPSMKACVKEGTETWVPLIESQWPTDTHLTIYCTPCHALKTA